MAGEPKQYTDEQIDALVAEKVTEATAGLKANRDELAKEAKQAKARLANYDGVDPEKYKQLLAASEDAERKRLQGEGDFKQLEAQLVRKYEGMLETEKGVSTRYRMAVERHLIDSAAVSELAKHSDSPRLLLPHVRSRMKVVEQDDEFHARIVDEHGNIRVGKGQGSTPMTLAELVEEMKSDREFSLAFRGSGSSGGGASKSTGGAGGKRTIAATDDAAFIKYAKEIASGEVEVVS